MIPASIAAAAVQGDNEVVAAWLDEHPERVNEVSERGASLLLECIENHDIQDAHLELARHLLSRGADPNQMCYIDDEESLGWMTPLYWICMEFSPHAHHIVACLLSAGADPNLRLANRTGDPDSEDDSSSDNDSNSTPLLEALRTILGNLNGSGQLSVVARLLKAGASLDNPQGLSPEETIAEDEREWPQLARNNVHFKAAKTLIRGVRAAGSWKKYCRARAPHREILALRSLAMRGYITQHQKRRTRATDWKAAVAFVSCLGDNGVVWNILSFWRDPDDIEDIAVDDDDEIHGGDVVRVYV